jgi:hypothetical protein
MCVLLFVQFPQLHSWRLHGRLKDYWVAVSVINIPIFSDTSSSEHSIPVEGNVRVSRCSDRNRGRQAFRH